MSVPSFPIHSRYLPNQIQVMLQKYAGRVFACNHIYLTGTQKVPYPILHNLSADITTSRSIVTNGPTSTPIADGFNIVSIAASGGELYPYIDSVISSVEDVVQFTINVKVNSGTVRLNRVEIILDVGGPNLIEVDETFSTDRTYTFELDNKTALIDKVRVSIAGNLETIYDIDFTTQAKEITLPTASYLTIFDSDTSTIKQLSSTGDVGENLVTNGDFSDDDISDWEAIFNADLSVVEGRLEVAYTDTANALARYQLDMISGKTYTARCDTKEESERTGNARLDFHMIADAGSQASNLNDGLATGVYDGGINKRIDFYNMGLVGYSSFDNLTTRESLPISTHYDLDSSHQFVFNHTSPLTDADIAAIEADPNLAFRMFFDGEVLPSGFSRANDMVGCNFFGGNEGLATAEKVYDLSDQTFTTYVSIEDYDSTCKTELANKSTSASNLKLIQDGSGRTTGIAAEGTISHTSDGHVDTEWLPNISKYSITETVTGDLEILDAVGAATGSSSVRTETRVLTHEEGVADKLYIDTVLQSYTPSLPNPLVTLKLGQTASIGYADILTSRSADFKVQSIVIVP